MLEVLRKGLVASRCVYTTLTGFSYYYLGLGCDIGYDAANGYPNSIPVDQTPFGRPGTSGFVNNITGARSYVRQGTAGTTYWWGMPWLGDLYPDSAYTTQWFAPDAQGNPRGNLLAGSGSSAFRHEPVNVVHTGSARKAFATRMPPSLQRLKEEGCTSFFNTGTASSTFHHQYASGIGALTAVGNEIATNYNFNMPTTAPISRPFSIAIDSSGTVGSEWNFRPYSTARFGSMLLRTYYDHPTRNVGSGLVQLSEPSGANSAFVVVNGIDRTVESGSNFIAKFAVLSLVHSFFEAGGASVTNRIEQPPRVEIMQPTDVTEIIDPDDIEISVGVTWKRWDGMAYTGGSTVTENESELEYVLTYSNDGGTSWHHVRDGSLARPGERPVNSLLLTPDSGVGPENYTWQLPSSQFPQGSYYLRVDCFRRGAPIHFSYHKTKLFVQR